MREKFDPSNEEYKSIEDLPKEHQDEFANVEGGFVRKEVVEHEERLEKTAQRFGISEGEITRLEAEEEDRLRSRTKESIDKFNINEAGLATHGTFVENLPDILNYGLGYDETRGKGQRVCYHVIGSKLKYEDEKGKIKSGKFGFGENEQLYTYENQKSFVEIFLVTDAFKRLWPKHVSNIVKRAKAQDSNTEHIVFNSSETTSLQSSATESMYLDFGSEGQKQKRKIVGASTYNAIVIPWETRTGTEYMSEPKPQEEVLKQVIEMEKQLLPRLEQIPIYSPDGECLYNPLKDPEKSDKKNNLII